MNRKIPFLLAFLSFGLLQFFSCREVKQNSNESTKDSVIVSEKTEIKSPQPLWKELKSSDYEKVNFNRKHFRKYKMFTLDSVQMRALLHKASKEKLGNPGTSEAVIEIPNPEGQLLKFKIYETITMDSSLAAKYPELKTYGGNEVNDNSSMIRLDFNPNGFHAYIRSQEGEWFIQPPAKGISHQYLICFYKQDMIAPREPFELPDSMRK
jgi:hypothetical protein